MSKFKTVLKYTGIVAGTAAVSAVAVGGYWYFFGGDADGVVDAVESVTETIS